MSEPERQLGRLLELSRRDDTSEADIKSGVRNLIESLVGSGEVRQEVSVQGGNIDLLVRNTIIEAKKDRNRLGIAPNYVSLQERRNFAATQLQDYVDARYSHVSSSDSSFRGFTTNGSFWKQWEVRVGGEMPILEKSYDLSEQQMAPNTRDLFGYSATQYIREFLENLYTTIGGRVPPPTDLAQLLSTFPQEAEDMAWSLVGEPEFETKRALWEDLMRGAFIVKSDDNEQNLMLFAHHSVLVEIALRVIKNISDQSYNVEYETQQGFSTWLQLSESSHKEHPGGDLLMRLHYETDRYDWRSAHTDVLKDVYHAFIPPDIRHDFGQYFTPDWLTDAVCEKVMNDEWCRWSVAQAANRDSDLKGCGVLDPGCGSGTFLRSAVNRLKPFASEITEDLVEQSNIICRLVHGLDIHPVAVEIAKATVMSSLPAVPTDGTAAVQIYLADSLRWVLTTDQRIIDQGGLLIQVPDDASGNQRYLQIHADAVSDPHFSELLHDLMVYSDEISVIRSRIESYGFEADVVSELEGTAKIMQDLQHEKRNHVWLWYIENVAQAHRFHVRQFDRLVGNPPWITRRDLDQSRKELHRREATKLDLWVGGATYSSQNNYAALFATTSIRDYMSRDSCWYAGIVMPWSTLRSKVWEKFRSGKWSKTENGIHQDEWQSDMSELPWDLRNVKAPPFRQSDSCAIFIKRDDSGSIEFPIRYEEWKGVGIEPDGSWSEIQGLISRTIKNTPIMAPSDYFEHVRNGATIFPYGLVRIDADSMTSGGLGITRFNTVMSNQGVWKGLVFRGQVEQEYVRKVVFSTDVAPFRLLNESFAVLPNVEILKSDTPELMIAHVQHFGRFWESVDSTWRDKKSQNSPLKLVDQIDHLGKLTSQEIASDLYRVVYPSSGHRFFGLKLPGSMIIEHKCYYINVGTNEEADYLAAVLSAQCLQRAFVESKVSSLDFGTYPLSSIPIPKFDVANKLHCELSLLGERAESVAASVPLTGGSKKMRSTIIQALEDDGVSGEIDRHVREFLPDYVHSDAKGIYTDLSQKTQILSPLPVNPD